MHEKNDDKLPTKHAEMAQHISHEMSYRKLPNEQHNTSDRDDGIFLFERDTSFADDFIGRTNERYASSESKSDNHPQPTSKTDDAYDPIQISFMHILLLFTCVCTALYFVCPRTEIREIIKEVPYEVIKEIPYEVVKEVPIKVIKRVPIYIKEPPLYPTEDKRTKIKVYAVGLKLNLIQNTSHTGNFGIIDICGYYRAMITQQTTIGMMLDEMKLPSVENIWLAPDDTKQFHGVSISGNEDVLWDATVSDAFGPRTKLRDLHQASLGPERSRAYVWPLIRNYNPNEGNIRNFHFVILIETQNMQPLQHGTAKLDHWWSVRHK